MKTRSRAKILPQVIVIESEKQSVEELKSDDSSCSDAENSSNQSSVQSDSSPFVNLAPIHDRKKKNTLAGLRTFLSQEKTTLTQTEVEFQRAPVLNLLRPLPMKPQHQVNNDSSDSEDIDVDPPQLSEDSEEEQFKQPEPRKKPRLMDELQKELNLPAVEYVVTGAGRELRQQRKRENKKRDYLIEKKFKEYKVGKKKDNVSNQVFNAIEDFFG